MNYIINGINCRRVPTFPIDLTDFSDFTTCFHVMAEALLKPGSYIALKFLLQAENPMDDHNFVVNYTAISDGRISISILDEDANEIVGERFELVLKEDGKIAGRTAEGETTDADCDEIVKIILDYGVYASLGVQWGAFLLKENSQGTLTKYFDELLTQEIH